MKVLSKSNRKSAFAWLIPVVAITLTAGCKDSLIANQTGAVKITDTSSVSWFNYGGYSDTSVALISGKVFERLDQPDGSDSIKPLPGVSIEFRKIKKSTLSDSNGEFLIGVEKGIFSIIISKKGYESITLDNYRSDPDQVSYTQITLVKGNEQRSYNIPPPTSK
ncbi:carboxypeptidase-like regulatory domain-containing protein [Flavihumibacter petaseus]|uniref:Carboxypeptidase regulatory-like domain-containing protein n=1 Tax=Flavihumibacter petaseus NBRC 106054 TaxID=1220578 RepID=A0A0E9MVA2_9BACT|nr:carboxypeptidase-like regulatory domain-containing protein [Flavihumibacter petaseus]GAO41403.1 hypothetical protein FPE01S_01_04150 [Flavihumibacter petaseus NBRC 106054]